jgi:hypothetical protein
MMTIRKVLNGVFPSGVLRHLITEDRGAFEIIGLSKNSRPQNCKILARGQDTSTDDRREFSLVRAEDGTMLFFSICTAAKDADEFVTGHGFAVPEDVNVAIREIARLRKRYGRGRWRKRKGNAEVRLGSGEVVQAEVHWYEATGIGKREFK